MRITFFLIITILSFRIDARCQSVYDAWYKEKPDGVFKEYHKNDSLSLLLVKKMDLLRLLLDTSQMGRSTLSITIKMGKPRVIIRVIPLMAD